MNSATDKQEGVLNSDHEEIKEVFEILDKDQIGKINKSQLQTLIRTLNYNPPDDCFQELDHPEEDGYDFDEVVKIINTKIKPNSQNSDTKDEDGFLDACRAYDPQNTGFITIPQMVQVLESFEAGSGEEFYESLRLAEYDYGDHVDYKNFFSMMTLE